MLACYHLEDDLKCKPQLKIMRIPLVFGVCGPNQSERISKVVPAHHESDLNVCTEVHGNPSKSCWDISIKTCSTSRWCRWPPESWCCYCSYARDLFLCFPIHCQCKQPCNAFWLHIQAFQETGHPAWCTANKSYSFIVLTETRLSKLFGTNKTKFPSDWFQKPWADS